MAPAPPTQIRRVTRKPKDAENPFERNNYVVTRSQIAPDVGVIYEAWVVANGRTHEFETTQYIESEGWLGRISSELDGDRAAQNRLAYDLIYSAFPEIHGLEPTQHIGALLVTKG